MKTVMVILVFLFVLVSVGAEGLVCLNGKAPPACINDLTPATNAGTNTYDELEKTHIAYVEDCNSLNVTVTKIRGTQKNYNLEKCNIASASDSKTDYWNCDCANKDFDLVMDTEGNDTRSSPLTYDFALKFSVVNYEDYEQSVRVKDYGNRVNATYSSLDFLPSSMCPDVSPEPTIIYKDVLVPSVTTNTIVVERNNTVIQYVENTTRIDEQDAIIISQLGRIGTQRFWIVLLIMLLLSAGAYVWMKRKGE